MGFFTGTSDKLEERPRTEEQEIALQARRDLATTAEELGTEGITQLDVAPLSDLEQKAADLTAQFMEGDNVTIDKAIEIATQIAEQKIDLNTPEIQGIIQEV